MKPIDFKESNIILKAPVVKENSIQALKVYTDGDECVSCWKMSWRERLSALIFGKVWLFVLSGKTQPAIAVEVNRTAFEEEVGSLRFWYNEIGIKDNGE